jgi:hypothetical protein
MHSARAKLAVDLSVSFATTSACVVAAGILTPLLFISWYGTAYSGLTLLFGLLFLTQWIAGALRPGLRQLAADWDLARVRRIMFVSMAGAIAVSLAGVNNFGPLAAAAGNLAGALLLNGQALSWVFKRIGARSEPV